MGGTRLTGDDAWFVGKFRIIPIWGVVPFPTLDVSDSASETSRVGVTLQSVALEGEL